MCHGIIQRLPSTQPYRYKWGPNSVTLDFLFLPSLALQSLALKTSHLTNVSWHPQSGAPQLGCQIWTPGGVRHVLFLLLWLFGVDTQCWRHSSGDSHQPQWCICWELLLPDVPKPASSPGARGVLASEHWRKDPRLLPHLALKMPNGFQI